MEQQTKLRAICGCGFSAEIGKALPGITLSAGSVDVITAAVEHAKTLAHTVEFHGEVRVMRGKVVQ